jgi:hypothetical protein
LKVAEGIVDQQLVGSASPETGVKIKVNHVLASSQPATEMLSQQLVRPRGAGSAEEQALRELVLACRYGLAETWHAVSGYGPQCLDGEHIRA